MPHADPPRDGAWAEAMAEYERENAIYDAAVARGERPPRPVKPHTPGWPAPTSQPDVDAMIAFLEGKKLVVMIPYRATSADSDLVESTNAMIDRIIAALREEALCWECENNGCPECGEKHECGAIAERNVLRSEARSARDPRQPDPLLVESDDSVDHGGAPA